MAKADLHIHIDVDAEMHEIDAQPFRGGSQDRRHDKDDRVWLHEIAGHQQENVDQQQESKRAKILRQDPVGQRRGNVLVAEDEAAIALMIEDVLTEAGFVVVGPAVSTNAALTLVEREVINCAVLDVKLVDGISLPVAEALTARRIPFVVATGYSRESIPPAYKGAPILTKLFMPHELIDAVICLLDLRVARSAIAEGAAS